MRHYSPARDVTYLPYNGISAVAMPLIAEFQWTAKSKTACSLVYASEGMRATLVPQFPHLSMTAVLVASL